MKVQKKKDVAKKLGVMKAARLQVLAAALIATVFVIPFKYATSGPGAWGFSAATTSSQRLSGAGAGLGLLICASLLLLPFAAFRSLKVSRSSLKKTSELGLRLALAAAVGNAAQGFAFSTLHAGVATVFIQMSVIFVGILGALWLGEAFGRVRRLAACLAVFGVILTQGSSAITNFSLSSGVYWAVLAAFGFALLDLISRRYSHACDPVIANFERSVFAALLLCFIPGALTEVLHLKWDQYLALLIAASLGPVLARLLLIRASQILPAIESSLIQQLRPALALPLASLIFQDWPTLQEWLGCSLVLAAVLTPIAERWFRSRFPKPCGQS